MRKGLLQLLTLLLFCVGLAVPVSAKTEEGAFATFSPNHGKSGVSISEPITLSFLRSVKLANGEALTSRKAEAIVSLVEKQSGKAIGNQVSWSSSKLKLTVKPTQPLPYATTVVFKLLPGTVKDSAGNLNRGEEAEFITEAREPEFVITSRPSHMEQNVAKDSNITITFNKTIQMTNGKPLTKSAVEKMIKLTDEKQKKVKFAGSWDDKTQTITLDPQGNLQDGTRYTVILPEKSIMDRQGAKNPQVSFTFTTAVSQDRIPPSVTVTPAHGAKGVSLEANVTLQFGEEVWAVDGSVLSNKAVIGLAVWKDEKGTVVPHSVTWNKRTRTLTMRVKGKMQPFTTYTIILPGNLVKDEAGNVNQPVRVNFSTGGK